MVDRCVKAECSRSSSVADLVRVVLCWLAQLRRVVAGYFAFDAIPEANGAGWEMLLPVKGGGMAVAPSVINAVPKHNAARTDLPSSGVRPRVPSAEFSSRRLLFRLDSPSPAVQTGRFSRGCSRSRFGP